MAIVKMSSFSLVCLQEDRDQVLKSLQNFGNVHFKDLEISADSFMEKRESGNITELMKSRELIGQYLKEIGQYEKGQRKLIKGREKRKQMLLDLGITSLTFKELEERALSIDINSILSIMDESKTGEDEKKALKKIEEIRPWEQNKLKDRFLIEMRDSPPIIGTLSSDVTIEFLEEIKANGQIYALAVKEKENQDLFLLYTTAEQRENAKILGEKYHMKRRSADSAKMNREMQRFTVKIDKMLNKRHRTDDSITKLSQHKYDLMIYAEYLQNLILREQEAGKFLYSESTVLIEGWIPTDLEQEFTNLMNETCKNKGVLKLEESHKDDESTPVQLQNNKFTEAFVGITNMYATPKYNEIDPTPVFTPFYLLFFGMMLADIGYGLLMMVVMFIALKLIKLEPSTKKFVKFLFYLSFPTMLWGYIYGSFFGSLIPMKPIIDSNSEYNRVLIMAIVFGVIHLLFALGVKAYMYIRDGHILDAIFDVVFWYMTLLGVIAFLLKGFVPALEPYSTVITIVMAAGMLGIILTNGRDAKTIFGKVASGLYSLYGLTNYVSDFVSYSRLMALGLAGGSIGIAVNMIVSMIIGGLGIIGIIPGVAVFIFFHMFNIFISGLSSYVHSSRLIYVEFFSKFYTGGGVLFKPFRAKHSYINIV